MRRSAENHTDVKFSKPKASGAKTELQHSVQMDKRFKAVDTPNNARKQIGIGADLFRSKATPNNNPFHENQDGLKLVKPNPPRRDKSRNRQRWRIGET